MSDVNRRRLSVVAVFFLWPSWTTEERRWGQCMYERSSSPLKSTTVTLNGRFPSFLAKVSLNVGIICSGSTAAVAFAAHRTARWSKWPEACKFPGRGYNSTRVYAGKLHRTRSAIDYWALLYILYKVVNQLIYKSSLRPNRWFIQYFTKEC